MDSTTNNLSTQTELNQKLSQVLVEYARDKDRFTGVLALINAGADVNTTCCSLFKSTALYLSVQHNDIKAFNTLLAIPGIDINYADRFGFTTLMLACRLGQAEMVNALLEPARKVDVNYSSIVGYTALTIAAEESNPDIVKALLAIKGIEVNHACHYGYTALMNAAETGNIDHVDALLDVPAIDILFRNQEGGTALTLALSKGFDEIARSIQIAHAVQDIPGLKAAFARVGAMSAPAQAEAEAVTFSSSTPENTTTRRRGLRRPRNAEDVATEVSATTTTAAPVERRNPSRNVRFKGSYQA